MKFTDFGPAVGAEDRHDKPIIKTEIPHLWRDVVGLEGRYQVSNRGLVRSLDRPVRCISGGKEMTRIARGKLLRPSANASGHLVLKLGRGRQHRVHALVAAAFIGPRPDRCDIAHLNGNPGDNRLENLAYVSRTENNRHVAFHGRRRLSVDQVRYIKERAQGGATTALRDELAQELGTNRRHISKVIRGETYSYV